MILKMILKSFDFQCDFDFQILFQKDFDFISRYCFGNYVYLFLIYFSFLINVLFNADLKMQSVFGGRI